MWPDMNINAAPMTSAPRFGPQKKKPHTKKNDPESLAQKPALGKASYLRGLLQRSSIFWVHLLFLEFDWGGVTASTTDRTCCVLLLQQTKARIICPSLHISHFFSPISPLFFFFTKEMCLLFFPLISRQVPSCRASTPGHLHRLMLPPFRQVSSRIICPSRIKCIDFHVTTCLVCVLINFTPSFVTWGFLGSR